ncbi:MAG: acyl-CoA dehydrogenase family protein [bacterium]
MIDFTPTETQEQIVKTARDFGREVLQPAENKLDRIANPDEVFESKLFWDVMGQAFDLGFHKMGMKEEYGGLELDPQTMGMVWEELGRFGPGFAASLMAGAVVPRLITFLAPMNEVLINEYVRPFCENDDPRYISAWGSSEPDIGSDGKNYSDPKVRHRTTATEKDDCYVIEGTKSNFISNGGIAKSYVVFACLEPEKGICGSGAFIVPADAQGITQGKAVDRIGLRTLNQAAVYFDDVRVPKENLLFPPGDAYPFLHNSIITVGNLGTGYLALGILRGAFEEALAYAKERVQWGKPIAEHQLVAQKLFEAHAAIESMRALLWRGSWLSATSFPGDLKTSLTAKINATNLAAHHTAEMMQVLGGYGLTRDYTIEKYTRDAPLLRVMDGTNETLMIKAAALL